MTHAWPGTGHRAWRFRGGERQHSASRNARRCVRLSTILSEIWRESEILADDITADALPHLVRRDIPVCSEAVSFDFERLTSCVW